MDGRMLSRFEHPCSITLVRHPASPTFPLVTLLKAWASQLIVWHHLVFYGPLSDVVHPHASVAFDWLYEHARIAVQVFLVVGGFLAAKTMFALFEASGQELSLTRLLRQRYVRLAPPYLVAVVLAVAAAAWARAIAPNPTVPDAPTFSQLLAHALLVHDLVGIDALSAGVWYVAIDFQLFAMLSVLLWLAHRVSPQGAGTLATAACAVLTTVSLLWFNRVAGWDALGLYFFGAYGLGILSYRASLLPQGSTRQWLAITAITLTVAAALYLQWRSRILVAAFTALALLTWAQSAATNGSTTRYLARISYSLFLVHYPVFLLVSSTVHHFWPIDLAANALGMVLTWALSIGVADLLHRRVEQSMLSRRNTPLR